MKIFVQGTPNDYDWIQNHRSHTPCEIYSTPRKCSGAPIHSFRIKFSILCGECLHIHFLKILDCGHFFQSARNFKIFFRKFLTNRFWTLSNKKPRLTRLSYAQKIDFTKPRCFCYVRWYTFLCIYYYTHGQKVVNPTLNCLSYVWD